MKNVLLLTLFITVVCATNNKDNLARDHQRSNSNSTQEKNLDELSSLRNQLKSIKNSINDCPEKDLMFYMHCNLEEIHSLLSCKTLYGRKQCDKSYVLLLKVATVITSIGLISNLATIFTLVKNKNMLPEIGRILLMHQAGVDACVCLLGILLYSQPFMWMTDNSTFDLLLCQAWHGQAFYWTAVFVSAWNAILFAYERFLKITDPFYYMRLLPTDICKALIPMYTIAVIFLLPAYFQVKYDHCCGKCLNEYYFDTDEFAQFFSFYGIFWFITVYAVPIGILVALFIKIKSKLRSTHQTLGEVFEEAEMQPINIERGMSTEVNQPMEQQSEENANNVRVRVSVVSQRRAQNFRQIENQITNSAIAVCIVFVLSLGWDAFYCLLGFTGAIDYDFNKPLQVTGVFLTSLASCATPFIYAFSMPIFRRRLIATLRCANPS